MSRTAYKIQLKTLKGLSFANGIAFDPATGLSLDPVSQDRIDVFKNQGQEISLVRYRDEEDVAEIERLTVATESLRAEAEQLDQQLIEATTKLAAATTGKSAKK